MGLAANDWTGQTAVGPIARGGEPPFGWIKSVLGFRQFSLRGLDNAACEWNLVTLAVNLRRMNEKIEWA